MNEQQLISHIEELGLSNKEARVYVAALIVGPSPVQRIADQSGIKRVTAYVILESLVGLGLISQSVKGKKTYFIAEEPSNLERLIEKREVELKEQKHNLVQILPELSSLKMLPKESPNVKFYDSADGIRTAMAAFFDEAKKSNADSACAFSNLDQFYSYFPEYRAFGANPQRLRSSIHSRMIYALSDGPLLKNDDAKRNRESRWLPLEKFPVSGDFTFAGDMIIMLALTGSSPFGITIKSRELTNGLQAIFEAAWEAAGSYNN